MSVIVFLCSIFWAFKLLAQVKQRDAYFQQLEERIAKQENK